MNTHKLCQIVRLNLAQPGPRREKMLFAITDVTVDQIEAHTRRASEPHRRELRRLLGRIQHVVAQLQAKARDEKRQLSEEEIATIMTLFTPDE